MTFSVRNFIRQVPISTLRDYFEARGAAPAAGVWDQREPKRVSTLASHLFSGSDPAAETILAELARVHHLASERGRNAFLNVAVKRCDFTEGFAKLDNDEERALWTLLRHPDVFRAGEELVFFDHYSEGNRGRHYRTKADLLVSRANVDVDAFKREICEFHRRRDGSGICCEIEFAERQRDNSTQVAIYIQGLPNHGFEFAERKFVPRVSTPALEAGIVYDPSNGYTSTVAKGGKEVHEAVRDAFARRLLKIEPRFDVVRTRPFLLDSLKRHRALAPDAAHGVRAVRVRKLKLVPPHPGAGLLTIEAPGGMPEKSVYDLGDSWFAERSGIYSKFTVVHATISMHFNCAPGATRAKTLNIELTKPNTSNLRNLPDADRKIAEAHIEKWQLIEPAA